MFASEVGEPLFFAKLNAGPRGAELVQTSHVGVPFEALAGYIVEPGFTIPKSWLEKPVRPLENFNEEAQMLEREMGDVIDDEVAKRVKAADPSYKEKSGIVVPGGKKDEGTS